MRTRRDIGSRSEPSIRSAPGVRRTSAPTRAGSAARSSQASIIELQRTAGNSAAAALLTGSTAGQHVVQRVNDNIAAEPTVESIKAAFPNLGARLATQYDKIDHNLTNNSSLEDLMATWRARLRTLELFRKAMLANGINGATKPQQARFMSREAGHIDAMEQLRSVITGAGHPNPDPATRAGIVAHLKSQTMTKQQIN